MSALPVGIISSTDGPLAVFTGGGWGTVLLVWLAAVNVVTFAVYGIDKAKAKRGAWRVPERTLFLLPLLGGSLGALLGMKVFRHKTKHWYFVWGIPLILVAQIALAIWLYLR